MLSDAETRVISGLLAEAWGPGCEIGGAAAVWDRRHVVRLQVGTDRSVIWPETQVPDYPALARPGSAPVLVPEWWQPEA